MNDITNIGYVFKKALDGGFRNETRWIDRKTYFENLEDPYVYLCFSFGNNPACRYAYMVEIEPWKKALHWYVFNDPSLMHEYGVDIPVCEDKAGYRKWIRNNEAYMRENYCAWVDAHRDEIEDTTGLTLHLERLSLSSLKYLQSLEHLQRLQRLQSLENPSSSLHIFQGDYRDVVIPKSSGVVYCDPPYLWRVGKSETLPRNSIMTSSILGASGSRTRTRIPCSYHRMICQATNSAEWHPWKRVLA